MFLKLVLLYIIGRVNCYIIEFNVGNIFFNLFIIVVIIIIFNLKHIINILKLSTSIIIYYLIFIIFSLV